MVMTAHEIMTNVAHNAAPEPGQLVEARRRQWIVSDVDGASVAPGLPIRHLVRLASIDEDALGEEIEVLWELEPGAHVIERAGLPRMTGIDDPSTLQAFLDAVLWGAATNADRGYLQAPFRSGVSIEDYQLDPLVRAIDMARTNLLIADDVGLGKTIEAGLVIQEMLLRHRARTVLVLCPASLQEKWRMEMQEKFGLEFRIVDTEYVKQLRRDRGLHANPWTSFPRLITSMDWAKQGEGLRLLRDALPPHVGHPRKFDLLIIDEAHNVAPTVGHYAVESLRTRLVRLAAPHFQHKLFLTATPHDGYTESFTALLELLDDQRFARNVLPTDPQLARVMVRRLKSDLVDANGKRIYPVRRLEALPVKLSVEERDARQKLEDYIKSRESEADGGRAVDHFVHQLLRKRLSSSVAAFAATLERHVATIEGRGTRDVGQKKFDDRILRRAIAKSEEDYADDAQREAAADEAIEEVGKHARPPSNDERQMLQHLRSWAQQSARRIDSKATALLEWLSSHLKKGDGWTNERVILFTEYRATQQWMQEVLTSHGFGADRLALIYGGMDPDDREAVKASFQADPSVSPVRILLATDAASEGIDLQNHCHLMIHLEIPYNPNVMEQRNGRIDRHGQRASEVVIWHPVDAEGGRPVNLATDGIYEIGSMFKLMTIGLALDTGKATLSSQLDARKALRVGPYAIHDYHAQKRKLNLTETFLYSSNIATARLGIMVGNEKQRAFLTRLGQFDAVDNGQGIGVTPVSAQNWNAIQHVSASFGQGIATSPLHAVASVATMVNGGYLVSPTFTPKSRLNENSQPVIKTGTSQILRGLLRKNTENGSARSADVEGYFVGGMTSTADKIKNGKYDPNSVVTTFIAAVPADDPKYVFMTLLDDPQASSETNGYRTAAWNAAVIARAVIEKAASELGLPIRKAKTHQAMR